MHERYYRITSAPTPFAPSTAADDACMSLLTHKYPFLGKPGLIHIFPKLGVSQSYLLDQYLPQPRRQVVFPTSRATDHPFAAAT